jgi:amino acid adenylation domain-containing protein
MISSQRQVSSHSDCRSVCVPESVAAMATKWPDAVALTAGSKVLTYRELDSQSNRLAQQLRSLGIGAGLAVGVCLPRSLELVVGALGILKAGGAYVPMDPAYPPDRLGFMLEDAQAPVLVTNPVLAQRLTVAKGRIVDIGAPAVACQPDSPPPLEIGSCDLAYVIYTSGSTGRPKGVEITHAGLANLVSWHQQAFSVTPADRASHVAGLGFDAAVWELWPYLAAGASVHLADEVTRTSAEPLRDWLLTRGITISFVPTPLAERLIALEWPSGASLRILLTGGDTLHHYPRTNLPFVLVNNYGPTECTVVATSGVVPPDSNASALPPIGWAIANAQIYLLDERLRRVPAGVPGEIHVGGTGLARGYRNRPDLTREKFIPNPFSSEPGSRLYKTGDLARILPDSQLVFLGRIDDQIKIRGYRIEPNEIVSALNRHPDVAESLIVAREDISGDKQLVAYVVLHPDSTPTLTGLRGFLREWLPEHMLPAAFVRLEAFPLTAHGKIDRGGLPAPTADNTVVDDSMLSPPSPVEERLAGILTRLLGVARISIHDNFFELGGHSLLAAQVIVRVRDSFGVQLSLRGLFEHPTVREISAEIERLILAKPEGTDASAEACVLACRNDVTV